VQAGVPMVTMYGRTMVSRMGLSVLTDVNKSCNALSNIIDYENKVFEISENSKNNFDNFHSKIFSKSMKLIF
jgi:predicted O-linked N-acetylglucosamine transferase (SPINDLY family)